MCANCISARPSQRVLRPRSAYAITRLNIDDGSTQVLFFKLTDTTADFESMTTTMSVDDDLMAVSEDDLRERLSRLIKSYIWDAKI
jgi:hypothetical protein